MSVVGFSTLYLRRAVAVLEQLDVEEIERAAELVFETLLAGRTVFVAGNGGSAALADHLACDLGKSPLGRAFPTPPALGGGRMRRPRVLSLSANGAVLTAWSNDVGYEHAFAEQLRSLAEPDDLLLVISASGNSPNIVKALEAAPSLGVRTLAWVGFDGGVARRLAERSVHVAVDDYGLTESAHDVLSHLTIDLVRNRLASMDSAPDTGEVTRVVKVNAG